jgi:hypothetical protein
MGALVLKQLAKFLALQNAKVFICKLSWNQLPPKDPHFHIVWGLMNTGHLSPIPEIYGMLPSKRS